MLVKLDLRFNGKLKSEISHIFNIIAYKYREGFNQLVSDVSQPYINNLDWWVQGPASRNTFSSSFFHYFCCLYLLRYLIEAHKFSFSEIAVDSPAVKSVFEKILSDSNIKDCKIYCKLDFKGLIKKFVKKYLLIYILFFMKIFQLLIARLTRKNIVKNIPSTPLVLIDTFVIPGYVSDDRWYGNLWDNLTEDQRTETFFVPTVVLTPPRSMYSVYKDMRSNVKNFILKEDYLTLSDVCYALNYKKRINKIQIKSVSVLTYDFSAVIQEELENNPDVPTVVESILTYRFIERIRLAGINVRLAIDWFEGQVIDKAWNMGFKHAFPNAKTIGYRAFESFPFYLCSYPLPIEKEAGVIPAVMAVQGKGTLETVNEFMPDLETIVIPSFKSSHVWDDKDCSGIELFTMLVTLPISLYTSIRITRLFCKVCEKLAGRDEAVKVVIKPHPTHSIDEIIKSLNIRLPENLSFSNEKSLSHLLKRSNLLVTEASSTCLEAMACGLSVIMMENEEGLTFDSIPDRIPSNLYKKTRSEEQLIKAIEYYIHLSPNSMEQHKIDCKKVREDYFQPITQDGIDRFMDLETNKRISNA